LTAIKSLTLLHRIPDREVDDSYLKALREANLLHTWPAAHAGTSRAQSAESVTRVWFDSEHITGAGLRELRAFKNLTTLSGFVTEEFNSGLRELRAFTKLESLWLIGPVTDSGLKELAPLKNLRSLSLDRARLRGVGFKHLTGLENLREVSLSGTGLSEEG